MLVVCVGTATEVGKTWVGAATLAGLRAAGWAVSARKPAQSFDPDDAQPLDAAVLAEATGERPQDVCADARTYRVPMAPPMAAAVLGQPPPTLAELLAELVWPDPEPELRWVETVGGPRSPIAVDGDAVDLARALRPDRVVLVADAGLGTINAVRLSVEPLRAIGHTPHVVLNRFDPDADLHRRNARWLADHDLVPLLGPGELIAALQVDLAR